MLRYATQQGCTVGACLHPTVRDAGDRDGDQYRYRPGGRGRGRVLPVSPNLRPHYRSVLYTRGSIVSLFQMFSPPRMRCAYEEINICINISHIMTRPRPRPQPPQPLPYPHFNSTPGTPGVSTNLSWFSGGQTSAGISQQQHARVHLCFIDIPQRTNPPQAIRISYGILIWSCRNNI